MGMCFQGAVVFIRKEDLECMHPLSSVVCAMQTMNASSVVFVNTEVSAAMRKPTLCALIENPPCYACFQPESGPLLVVASVF